MRNFLVSVLLLTSLNCNAEWNNWSDTDKTMFVVSQVAMTMDWATTRYGSRHYNELPHLHETNVFLGNRPSTDKVDLYFIGLLVSNYYIADYIHPSMRGFYLGVRTATHYNAAKNNVSLGWQMKF
jgi:hypothetical protein